MSRLLLGFFLSLKSKRIVGWKDLSKTTLKQDTRDPKKLTINSELESVEVDKAVAEDLKSLKLYSSEPLQGVIVRAIQALKSGKQ